MRERRRVRRGPGQGRGAGRASTACPTSPASATASSRPSPAQNIVVDMIAQNVGTGGKAAIGFTVPEQRAAGDAGRARSRWPRELGRHASSTRTRSARCRSSAPACGRTPASPSGCSRPWRPRSINMKMITTGDIKISRAGRHRPTACEALRAVHQAFGLDEPRPGAGQPARPATGRSDAGRPSPTPSRDLAALTAAAGEHGRHRRQRRAARHRPGPDHALRPARPAGQLLAASSRRSPPAGIIVDMIVQNLTGRAGPSCRSPCRRRT